MLKAINHALQSDWGFVYFVLLILGGLGISYALARVSTLAYFRSKRDFVRSVMKNSEGESDGKR